MYLSFVVKDTIMENTKCKMHTIHNQQHQIILISCIRTYKSNTRSKQKHEHNRGLTPRANYVDVGGHGLQNDHALCHGVTPDMQ